jgi:hypothetical protein
MYIPLSFHFLTLVVTVSESCLLVSWSAVGSVSQLVCSVSDQLSTVREILVHIKFLTSLFIILFCLACSWGYVDTIPNSFP